jgi:Zn-dependent protease with chaperone function
MGVVWTALGLWAAWIIFHFVLMLIIRPSVPSATGFRIVIPRTLFESGTLTLAEVAAVVAHEEGHRRRGHVWQNFALVCVFARASAARRRAQELQADDYAASRVPAFNLASALRKLSRHPFDLERAIRLEAMNG